jgi:two-component system, OmpR family, sensor histidine kinase QseC
MSTERGWSLRGRLLTLLVALTTGLFVAGAVQNYFSARDTRRQLSDESLRASAGLLLQLAQHEISEHGEALGVSMLQTETRAGPYDFRFQLWTPAMRTAYDDGRLGTEPLLPASSDGFGWTAIDNSRWRSYVAWSADHSLSIQIAQPLTRQTAIDRSALIRSIVDMSVLLLLGSGMIWWILTISIKPLQETVRSVDARNPADLKPVDQASAPSEIKPLLAALNRLFDRIRNALETERRFTADAAHELRSPLAAIRSNAQVLIGARSDEERQQCSRDLIAGVDRSARIVDQLLILARADATPQVVRRVEVDLADLLAEQCREQSARAQSLGIDLCTSLLPTLISGDRPLLAIMIRNLLDNALRYTPRGGFVQVSCGSHGEFAQFSVADTGSGVLPEDRRRIFERFYRVLENGSAGSGLGLSIVSRIAELHDGEVTLTDGPGGKGSCFTVRFSRCG